MADEKNLPAVSAVQVPITPAAEPWQTAPPGPPGAAVDPPPCVTPKVVAAQLQATREARASDGAPYPPPLNAMDFCHLVSWQAPFKAAVPTPRAAGQPSPAEVTFEPVHLGKPTPVAELEKRARAAGWKPPEPLVTPLPPTKETK